VAVGAVPEARHHGGVERAAVAGQHTAAGGGGPIARHEHVLVRDRHAQQRRVLAACAPLVGRAGLRETRFLVQRQKGAQRLVRAHALQQCLRHFDTRDAPLLERCRQLGHAHVVQFGTHSITRGTRYKPPSTAGALA